MLGTTKSDGPKVIDGEEAVILARVEKNVADHWSGANIRNAEVTDQIRGFLDGTLYFVTIDDAVGQEHENYVFVKGERLVRFDNLKEVVRGIGEKTRWGYIHDMFAVAGVTGLLALILIVTVCILAIKTGNAEIIKTLGYALTSILGYYFGTVHTSTSQKSGPK